MVSILIPEEGQSWMTLKRSLEGLTGTVLVVLSGGPEMPSTKDEEGYDDFLHACSAHSSLYIASLRMDIVREARGRGILVLDHSEDVKVFLTGNAQLDEVLRLLSPHVWRQQLRSRLQSMGLLSMPRLRVWCIGIVSVLLLFFVLFRLLPSAEIVVRPKVQSITQTVNIFLVQSGALIDIPPRVRTLDLLPVVVAADRRITFDQISKEFIGTNARVPMTIINDSNEEYSFRKGTRLVNEAGMIFQLEDAFFIEPGKERIIRSTAVDKDLYGEIIGERGNLPAGVRWNFLNLPKAEQQKVYAKNREPSSGGKTDYTTALKQSDIDAAVLTLRSELLSKANQLVDEEILLHNDTYESVYIDRLYYDEFTSATYSGFVLPTQFIGEKVQSIPVEGGITYTAYAFDKKKALDLLATELYAHTGKNRSLRDESIDLDRFVYHVIDYAEDISWIKMTADLTGLEQFILDPLTPEGARFAKKIRESVLNLPLEEAQGVIENYPEVDSVEISAWPPWTTRMPVLPTQIVIKTDTDL